jgi:hypothetical protein
MQWGEMITYSFKLLQRATTWSKLIYEDHSYKKERDGISVKRPS